MAGDPADVGGTPVHVGVGLEVEDVLVGERHLGEVPAGGVHDAFGLRRGARGVEDVEELLGVHRLGGAVGRGVGHEVVPPVIAAVDHLGSGVAAVDDDDVFDGRCTDIQGCVDVGFEGGRLTAAIAGVSGDDELGFGVFATIGDGVW